MCRRIVTTRPHSARAATFLDHVDVVISVHGFGGVRDADDRWTTALLGGSNRALACRLHDALTEALPGYRWIDDIDVIPRHLRGVHPANPGEPRAERRRATRTAAARAAAGADYDALVTTPGCNGTRCATSL